MGTRLASFLRRLLIFWLAFIILIILGLPYYCYWLGASVASETILMALIAICLMLCGALSLLARGFFLVVGNALAILGIGGAAVAGVINIQNKIGWQGLTYDAKYGVVGLPYFPSFHWNLPDFRVRYTFDQFGWRSTPKCVECDGDVLFLGCSYTFGIGVEDNEAYPAVLAGRYWRNYNIYNCGLSGRGVGDGLLALEEWLKYHRKPAAVFYGWMADQAPRNYRRRSWHVRANDGEFRLFDFKNGVIDYVGAVGIEEASLADSMEIDLIEAKLCVAIFAKIREICESQGIPFFVISLSSKYVERPDRVIPELAVMGFDVVDATSASSFFVNDAHPRPLWHEQVAKIIDNAVKTTDWTLHSPPTILH